MFSLRGPARRGSALSLSIVVAVVLTGLALTLAWLASAQVQLAAQMPRMDEAYYAAEAGIHHAIWKFKHDNTWRATSNAPFTGTITMDHLAWPYCVTCTDAVGDALLAWKFDETVGTTTADSSGHGNTGAFHGGASWSTPGRSGSCIQLDGVDGYVDCGNNSSTNLTGDMSFSAWVKMNSGYYDQKIGGNQNGSYGGYKLCIYNSKVEFEVRDSLNRAHLNRDVGGGTVLTMGSWYHVLGVYSAANRTLTTYVNGRLDRQLVGTGSGTGLSDVPVDALGSTSGNFVIGREPWTSLYYFNGWIDDIRIWNRALSAQDAKTLYDTTVTIHAEAASGTVSNFAECSCSIPTPAPPTIPAILTGADMTVKNITVNGDLAVKGNVTCTTGSSTVTGDLSFTGTYGGSSHLSVQGKTNAVTSLSFPSVDFTYLHNQATTWGQVVDGDSSGATFTFNSLGGNKVIWIKGNLKNPSVTIGGTYASGGTIVVDGTVNFSGGATTLGADGYPVYIVSQGNVSHTGGALTLNGGLYTNGAFAHKSLTMTGPLVVKKAITNNSSAQCTFTAGAIPWFDNRALPQSPTLPLYTTSHTGHGP